MNDSLHPCLVIETIIVIFTNLRSLVFIALNSQVHGCYLTFCLKIDGCYSTDSSPFLTTTLEIKMKGCLNVFFSSEQLEKAKNYKCFLATTVCWKMKRSIKLNVIHNRLESFFLKSRWNYALLSINTEWPICNGPTIMLK